MSNTEAVVSPGGVGFDINCGVRLLRTNLTEKDVAPKKEQLTQVNMILFIKVFFRNLLGSLKIKIYFKRTFFINALL